MRISEFTKEDYALIQSEYDSFIEAARGRCRDESELEMVQKAFDFANQAHKNVRRRSGVPYIVHPVEVAKIVINDIGLGCKSICAALLHDVVEDTEYTVDDIRSLFNDKIAVLVEGLTKIKTVLDNEDRNKGENEIYGKSLQAENFKRILLTLNDDVRVVLIKLADRLHNCRTIEFMPEHKRDKILSETMFIFVPLAHRLGLYGIKSEMENIWLKYSEPEAYSEINHRIQNEVVVHEKDMDDFIFPMTEALTKSGIRFEVKKRVKTPFSIWKKMQNKHVPFDQIYDLYAVRIIFDVNAEDQYQERQQAYVIFAIITGLYRFQPSRTRDWIKQPKSNGYEALHCTLMSQVGIWVEVQIRSRRMDDIAEKGIAAHWAYKSNGYISENDSEMDRWLAKVQEILVSNDVNALELLDIIHTDLVTSEIVVFTPKGDQRSIQNGSTALDFAYLIHTEIGNNAIAAKVNLKLVPLSQQLKSGDQVEIISAASARPKMEWLDFLRTRRARSAVMDYFRMGGVDSAYKEECDRNQFVLTEDSEFAVSICCHPIPGDTVVGIRREDGIIEIHKKTCPVAARLASKFGDSIVVPKWRAKSQDFPAALEIKGLDRVGLLNDITFQISRLMGINMRRLEMGTENGVFQGRLEILVKDKEVLDGVITAINKIDGIKDVIRVEI